MQQTEFGALGSASGADRTYLATSMPQVLYRRVQNKLECSAYFFARDAVFTAAFVAAVTFASAISTACFVALERLS